MPNPNGEKGKRAERELSKILADYLGVSCRRKLGAGRLDDCGDLDIEVNGEPIVVQVADYTDPLRAISTKLPDVAKQTQNAGANLGVLAVRRRGGRWVFCMDAEMFATWAREATA